MRNGALFSVAVPFHALLCCTRLGRRGLLGRRHSYLSAGHCMRSPRTCGPLVMQTVGWRGRHVVHMRRPPLLGDVALHNTDAVPHKCTCDAKSASGTQVWLESRGRRGGTHFDLVVVQTTFALGFWAWACLQPELSSVSSLYKHECAPCATEAHPHVPAVHAQQRQQTVSAGQPWYSACPRLHPLLDL